MKQVNKNINGRKQKEQSQQVPIISESSLHSHDPIEPNKLNTPQRNRNKANDIYNYFSNSLREDNDMKSNRTNDGQNVQELTNRSIPNPYLTYPLKSSELCDSCRSETEHPCNFCQQCRSLFPDQLNAVALPMICESCLTQPICMCCGKRICIRCKRPTESGSISPRHIPQKKITPPRAETTERRRHISEQSEIEDVSGSNSRRSSDAPQSNPYSFNVDSNSIFHPSYNRSEKQKLSIKVKNGGVSVSNDEQNELKKFTHEKLTKIAKNYGDMRARSIPRDRTIDLDSYPLPLIAPDLTLSSKYSQEDDKQEDQGENTLAFKQLEARWQVKNMCESLQLID